jgi:hypothetical protein
MIGGLGSFVKAASVVRVINRSMKRWRGSAKRAAMISVGASYGTVVALEFLFGALASFRQPNGTIDGRLARRPTNRGR